MQNTQGALAVHSLPWLMRTGLRSLPLVILSQSSKPPHHDFWEYLQQRLPEKVGGDQSSSHLLAAQEKLNAVVTALALIASFTLSLMLSHQS